jgi:hypothetical protein
MLWYAVGLTVSSSVGRVIERSASLRYGVNVPYETEYCSHRVSIIFVRIRCILLIVCLLFLPQFYSLNLVFGVHSIPRNFLSVPCLSTSNTFSKFVINNSKIWSELVVIR